MAHKVAKENHDGEIKLTFCGTKFLVKRAGEISRYNKRWDVWLSATII